MNEEIQQALEQLAKRCKELADRGLAQPHDLARRIDDFHARLLERYTTREGAERCR